MSALSNAVKYLLTLRGSTEAHALIKAIDAEEANEPVVEPSTQYPQYVPKPNSNPDNVETVLVQTPEQHEKINPDHFAAQPPPPETETVTYQDGSSATGTAPMPRISPSGSPAAEPVLAPVLTV